jgi:hypothetical protein
VGKSSKALLGATGLLSGPFAKDFVKFQLRSAVTKLRNQHQQPFGVTRRSLARPLLLNGADIMPAQFPSKVPP